jgi:hypothetical protein
MTPENAWLYGVLPFVTMAVLTVGFVVVFRQRAATRRAALAAHPVARRPDAPARPWWANPLAWLALALVSVLLGIFVWPGFLAFTFVVIPVLWWRRPKTPELDPRSNGHTRRDAGSFMPE